MPTFDRQPRSRIDAVLPLLVLCGFSGPSAAQAPVRPDSDGGATSSDDRLLLPLLGQAFSGARSSPTIGRAPSRPDNRAPIGVAGDTVHDAGTWALSYRFTRMDLEGSRIGRSRISDADVLNRFPIAPTRQTMDLHRFEAQFAPTDEVTLRAVLPYLEGTMDHRSIGGGRFRTQSSGVGDLRLAGLFQLRDDEEGRAHFNLGISAPTGSIAEEAVTPASGGSPELLPYPMQHGSGTWDVFGGITFSRLHERWSYGVQGLVTQRIGRNDRGYSLGERFDVTAWAAHRVLDSVSLSARFSFAALGNVDGRDNALDPAVAPTADPDRRGGTWSFAHVGANVLLPGGNRLALEVSYPIEQNLDGPQLETDLVTTIGWQLSF